jgi:hypothetical protein
MVKLWIVLSSFLIYGAQGCPSVGYLLLKFSIHNSKNIILVLSTDSWLLCVLSDTHLSCREEL